MFREAFEEHLAVVGDSIPLIPALEAATDLMESCLHLGGTVFAVGNGGSAADAQHFTSELVGRFEAERPPWRALALTVDSSALTSISNDYGYEHVFERQVRALARQGDVLVAISTSGTSPNVIAAARAALEIGCNVIALTGEGGGLLGELAGVRIDVPSHRVARIQEVHILCLHAIAELVEQRMSGSRGAGPGQQS